MKILKLFCLIVLIVQAAASRGQTMAVRFADSEIARFPKAWQLDHGKRLYWGYSQGLGCMAMLKVWKKTGDTKYFRYVEQWTDTIINDKGIIHLYKPETFNIDYLNAGKVLFDVYRETGKQKYKLAMDKLVGQMKAHPRTSEGAFWHKQIYPHQVWLDGIYMASPFLAQYSREFGNKALMDDVVKQIVICARHTFDERTGLYYHAWDESREQRWANKLTGQSPNFWGRSVGWWFMALVDVLDYLPAESKSGEEILKIVRNLAATLPRYADANGLFYQVLDKPGAEGNYPEASVNAMFMYAYAKAANRGYVEKRYRDTALKIFRGLESQLLRFNDGGSLTLTRCCAVAGLGGTPYRDGSYNYYIHERIRDNDAKATGPFIMGCLELNK